MRLFSVSCSATPLGRAQRLRTAKCSGETVSRERKSATARCSQLSIAGIPFKSSVLLAPFQYLGRANFAAPWVASAADVDTARSAGGADGGDSDGGDGGEEEETLELQYADWLNLEYGVPTMLEFSEGENGMPRLWMKHPYSSMSAEIYLHGACITQWNKPDGTPALFLKSEESFDHSKPINSGIKLCFPQYREGHMVEDGFANRLPWEVVAAGFDFLEMDDGLGLLPELTPEESWALLKDDISDELVREEAEEAEEAEVGAEVGAEASDDGLRMPLEDLSNYDWEALLEGAQRAEKLGEVDDDEEEEEEAEKEEEVKEAKPSTKAKAHAVTKSSKEEEAGEADDDEAEEVAEEGEAAEEGEEEDEMELVDDWSTDLNLDEETMEFKRRMDAGLDPAPFVTLRLTDTEDTREVWPHKFELLYKIQIMEEDDFQSISPGPDSPEVSLFQTPQLMALGDDETRPGGRLRPGAGSAETRMIADLGVTTEEPPTEDILEEDDPEAIDPFLEELMQEVPTQLRLTIVLRNKDPEGAEPMDMQIAALGHFATLDQTRHANFIKVLGLGGGNVLDYTEDPRAPVLDVSEEDFLHFEGDKIDTTFIGAAKADVKLCPGNRTHYELINRKGFKDVMMYHPGLDETRSDKLPPQEEAYWGVLGSGTVTTPTYLKPGEEWVGEMVIRYQNRYWEEPMFGEETMPPMPDIPKLEGEEEGTFQGVVDGVEDEFEMEE